MNRSIFLVSCHIPGKANIQADSMPKNLAHKTEWILDRAVFTMLTKHFLPEDLMATSENAQLETFVYTGMQIKKQLHHMIFVFNGRV